METLRFEGVEYRVFDHLYAAASDGRLLKVKTLRPAVPKLRPDGYLSVGRQRLAHRVVASCWVPQPEGSKHVHHINGDKTDNRASNLEWITPAKHAERHPGTWGGVRGMFSEDSKQKLREYRLGRKTSEETKRKQREANIRLGIRPQPRPHGYKHSEVAVARMVENSPNATRCEISGVVYRSFSEAGRALGMKPHTLRKRCLSSSFSDHKLLKDD